MEKTLRIEGMMCAHCAARLKEGLEALPGVERAELSHEAGTATLSLREEIEDGLLRETVEELGFTPAW